MNGTYVSAEMNLGDREEEVLIYHSPARSYPITGSHDMEVPETLAVYMGNYLVIRGAPDRVVDLLQRALTCAQAKLAEVREVNTAEVK